MISFSLAFCCLLALWCSAADKPEPPMWPSRFHAVMRQQRGDDLGIVDLWYDFPAKRNLNIVRTQKGEANGPLFDNELQNGTTYYYTPQTKECHCIQMGVGLLPPTWLQGATYLRDEKVGHYDCHVWENGDSDVPGRPFVTYWAEKATGRPAKWIFFDDALFEPIEWTPGATADDALFQLPSYCDDATPYGGSEDGGRGYGGAGGGDYGGGGGAKFYGVAMPPAWNGGVLDVPDESPRRPKPLPAAK